MMKNLCDLHVHSTCSDGTLTPGELVRLAEKLGLGAVALCDHNTVAGLPEFLEAARGSRVEIRYPYVPGWNDQECDAIGAFFASMKGISKVKVLGYHGYAGGKYAALRMPDTLPKVTVLAEDLEKPVAILRSYGLNAINGMVQD